MTLSDTKHADDAGRLAQDRPPIPSSVTGRLMLILECFRDSRRHLTLTDICRRTGLPTSTAHRLLSELCEWNALVRSDGGYRVSLRLFEIGVGAFTQENIYRLATPIMQDIFSVTDENVHLCMLDDLDVVFIAKLIGRRSRALITRPGSRLPAYVTASGRVMVAHAGEEIIERVLRSEKKMFTEHTITDEAVLRESFRDAAEKGFATSVDELRIGTMSIAAPVFDADGHILAALSVVGNVGTLAHRRVAPALRTAAMSLSRSLATHAAVPPLYL